MTTAVGVVRVTVLTDLALSPEEVDQECAQARSERRLVSDAVILSIAEWWSASAPPGRYFADLVEIGSVRLVDLLDAVDDALADCCTPESVAQLRAVRSWAMAQAVG